MQYHDFELEAVGSLISDGPSRKGTYQVRVLRSPMGEMKAPQAVSVEYDDRALQSSLNRLEERVLDTDGLIRLGSTLAAILLPISTVEGGLGVRELFAQSLVKISVDDGLRLRLRLPYELSVIPWEYMFVERAGGQGMDGFLALDPRTAIVRHEELAAPADVRVLTGDIKVVTAIAESPGMPELDLASEERVVEEGLKGLDVVVEPCRHATLAKLKPLLNGAGVFHFAGHGDFEKQMGPRVGTYEGSGFLAFEDGPVDAEQVALNLRSNGIRLAVLAACETARRDGYNVWSGIAPALVKALIPAVVANQYKIKDITAIAFSQQFYQSLAAGLPIERAVADGRIGAYNKDKSGRDWGVPVLYMRAGDGRLFEGAADKAARDRARESADGRFRVRIGEVKGGAVVVGAELARMLGGHLTVNVTVSGTVLGEFVGAKFEKVEGGSLNADIDIKEVGPGGHATAIKIGDFGRSSRTRGATRAKPLK